MLLAAASWRLSRHVAPAWSAIPVAVDGPCCLLLVFGWSASCVVLSFLFQRQLCFLSGHRDLLLDNGWSPAAARGIKMAYVRFMIIGCLLPALRFIVLVFSIRGLCCVVGLSLCFFLLAFCSRLAVWGICTLMILVSAAANTFQRPLFFFISLSASFVLFLRVIVFYFVFLIRRSLTVGCCKAAVYMLGALIPSLCRCPASLVLKSTYLSC